MGAEIRYQRCWMIRLNSNGTLIHSILPLLLRLPVHKNSSVSGLCGCDRRCVEISFVRTKQLRMHAINDFLYVIGIKRFRHNDPIGPHGVNLHQKIRVLRSEHDMVSHVVALDSFDQVLRSGIFGVDIDGG